MSRLLIPRGTIGEATFGMAQILSFRNIIIYSNTVIYEILSNVHKLDLNGSENQYASPHESSNT